MVSRHSVCGVWWVLVLAGICGLAVSGFSQEPVQPVKVTIKDDKPAVKLVETTLPIAAGLHAQVSGQGMMVNLRVNNQTMHLGMIQTVVKADNHILQQANTLAAFREKVP